MIDGLCLTYAFWPNRLSNSIFGIFVICIHFIIPLIILTYCNGRIIWILTRRLDSNFENDGGTSSLNNTQTSKDKFQLARTNTLKTFLLVGVCFVIRWINSQVYYLMHNLGFEAYWNSTYFHFAVLMVFMNSTVNPFIYLIKYRDYQEALRELLGFRKRETKSALETVTSSVSIPPVVKPEGYCNKTNTK